MDTILRTTMLACWLLMFMLSATVYAQQVPQTPEHEARQIWQLLDYVSVDYPGAVSAGEVVSETEYAEMREFTQRAAEGIRALPETAIKEVLVVQVGQLVDAVELKVAAADISSTARSLSNKLLQAYPIPTSPRNLPEQARGSKLYQSQCAACHGAFGAGDGAMSVSLTPPPIDFTDRERAANRSIYSLYQAISQGVAGTAMPAFDKLEDQDRWNLAFFVGTLSYDDAMREKGEIIWHSEVNRPGLVDMDELTMASEHSLTEWFGTDPARDVMAYLRDNPEAVQSQLSGSMGLARQRLAESLAALQSGDKKLAVRLALSSYLDGFEPQEPMLSAREPKLLREIETAMLAYRNAANGGAVDRAELMAKPLDNLLLQAQKELDSPRSDAASSVFLGAFSILLREGVEALLVVVGMLAFLRKSNRIEVLPYVHIGWVAALMAGGLTWLAATYLVDISGASRELTEGLSSLFAAVVLLVVGLWMHQKSSAGRWQAYIKGKLSAATTRRSAFALFTLAFVAVYREVFETVLFYSALWVDGSGPALLAGLFTAVAVLALVAWVLLRTSARIPIGKFFSISSVFVAVLAVVLTGKGVAALQEAGVFDATPLAGPRIEMLGVFPYLESVMAQLVVALIALAGIAMNTHACRRASETSSNGRPSSASHGHDLRPMSSRPILLSDASGISASW